MSKKRLIIGGVVAVVVLAAIGSTMGTPRNTPAGTVASPGATAGQSAVPAETALSTPGPSAAPSSYRVGDRVKLGEEEYFAVVETDPNVAPADVFRPEAGNKWVAALVEIEGINPNGATYNPFYFKLRDAANFEYTISAFGKEPSLKSSNDLQPGQKVRGWVTFEVPVDATGLVLIYTPGLVGEAVEVALG